LYIPDRVIVRKLKEYDPYLTILWNSRKQWFEVWREMPHGRRLITPVTQSIYDAKAPIEYCQLDERLLWWLYDADSWRSQSSKKHAFERDQRWKEFQIKKADAFRRHIYDAGKDFWQAANSFYATKHAPKNDKPKFNHAKAYGKWVRPNSTSLTAPRVVSRTGANARAYGFKR
jgi:hypothetical protein